MSKGVVQLLLEVLCMWLKRKKRIFSLSRCFWDLGFGFIFDWYLGSAHGTKKLPQPPINLLTSKPLHRTASGELWSKARWLGIRWICLGFVWMQQKHQLLGWLLRVPSEYYRHFPYEAFLCFLVISPKTWNPKIGGLCRCFSFSQEGFFSFRGCSPLMKLISIEVGGPSS